MSGAVTIQQAMHYCGLSDTEADKEIFVSSLKIAVPDYPGWGPDDSWLPSEQTWGNIRDAVKEQVQIGKGDGMVTLQQAMEYCGFETVNDQSMKVFLHCLRVAAPEFKGFGDDEGLGVNASEWNAIKDAVKAEAKIFTQGEG